MKNQLFIILSIFLSLASYSQALFEKGHYIDNNNTKTNCLIKNHDWKNNPSSIKYKLTKNGKTEKLNIVDLKEFEIYNQSKYIRVNINMDRSSDNISRLSTTRRPIFNKEKLFLKVLIESEASLYSYEDGNLKRFFFSNNNSDIEQLIFKKYIVPSTNKIGSNNRYKQQLLSFKNCKNINTKDIERLSYNTKSLHNFFVKYNNCNNKNDITEKYSVKKGTFNFNLKIGANKYDLKLFHYTASKWRNKSLPSQYSSKIGFELEYIFPHDKNKWAAFIEPTYNSYNTKTEIDLIHYIEQITINYKSIEIPVGLRYYLHLNESNKFFTNAALVLSHTAISNINYSSGLKIEADSNLTYALGIGYKNNDKLSIEFRYYKKRNFLNNYSLWLSTFDQLLIVLGYTLF